MLQGELPLGEESVLAPLPLDTGGNEADTEFVSRVWKYHRHHRRPMVWRDEITPYNVFVSEIMLQQTQVSRVKERFPRFLSRFPGFEELAAATLAEVLQEWSGLGYNRRARFLHEAARRIVTEYGGVMPEDPDLLATLPGVGKHTAGSIAAFAYNRPTLFLETNIRTVFIYYYFPGKEAVPDAEILPLLERTLQREAPREWYYALMDLGVLIKRRVGNLTRKSKGYSKQSAFKGSLREVRGAILRQLSAADSPVSEELLRESLSFEEERFQRALDALESEGMITAERGGTYRLRE